MKSTLAIFPLLERFREISTVYWYAMGPTRCVVVSKEMTCWTGGRKPRCFMESHFKTVALRAIATAGLARSDGRTCTIRISHRLYSIPIRTSTCSITPAKYWRFRKAVPRLLLRLNSKPSEQLVVTWDWQTE